MIAAHATLTASTNAPAGHTLDIARLRNVTAAMREGAIDWVGRTLCGLRGHSMMMRFESTRLSLHCASCGHTTPGWAIQAVRRNTRTA
jgi:hypothetical protein